MSAPVAPDELARHVDEHGPHPFLVTTGPDRRPHVVSVTVAFDGGRFSLSAGTTSQANLSTTTSITLLWPGVDGRYALIVDGTADLGDGAVIVVPTRAVLHRLAGADEELPNCVRIEATD